jgi:hypothetical protein
MAILAGIVENRYDGRGHIQTGFYGVARDHRRITRMPGGHELNHGQGEAGE